MTAPRISVVVPTFQRRDLAVACVRALAAQRDAPAYEVLVVVDGSTDGTAAALRALDVAVPLRVLEQPNRGRGAACNAGAQAAHGELLLFLDDDMEADPGLLAAHDRAHRAGADAVMGHMPLHPDSPPGLLSAGVGRWAEAAARRLEEQQGPRSALDVVTGQFSVRAGLFGDLGGFDDRFTRGGRFGGEDLELGHRLLAGGHRIAFARDAVSRQRYVTRARAHLDQYADAGRADVLAARTHPQMLATLRERRSASGGDRVAWRLVRVSARLARTLLIVLRPLAVHLVDAGREEPVTTRLFFAVRALCYWLGVERAGGAPDHDRVRVLCWHAVADLAHDPVLREYGVPPDQLADQLRHLGKRHVFVTPDEVLRLLREGAGVPRSAVLVTFDDCYTDLLDAGLGVLREAGVPAVAFAVSGRLGASNDWDQAIGASVLPLLDADGLRALADAGVEIGAHSRNHRLLPRVPDAEVEPEVVGSGEDLRALGLGRVRLFSYPHGERDARARRAAAVAYEAAFSVDPGVVGPGRDPHDLPRIEVFRSDRGWRLRLKVAVAGRHLAAWLPVRRRLAPLARRVRRLVRP